MWHPEGGHHYVLSPNLLYRKNMHLKKHLKRSGWSKTWSGKRCLFILVYSKADELMPMVRIGVETLFIMGISYNDNDYEMP